MMLAARSLAVWGLVLVAFAFARQTVAADDSVPVAPAAPLSPVVLEDVAHDGDLVVDAASVTVRGRVVARSIRIRATGLINVEDGASLTATGAGGVTLSGDGVVLVGSVVAQAGNVRIDALRVLHGGAVVSGSPAGRVDIACDRYIAPRTGSASAATHVRVYAMSWLFSSGSYAAAEPTRGFGGTVDLLGDAISLYGATADASSRYGGGCVNVGGGWQGRDRTRPSAHSVTIAATTTLRASATTDGPGGTVVVWSDERTRFAGTIDVAGAGTGDGGRAEVSSRVALNYAGSVDAHSPLGLPGKVLLDPKSITVDTAPSSAMPQLELPDPNPDAGSFFGADIAAVGATQIAVTDYTDDFLAVDAGAAYLFDHDGTLVSVLVGSNASDRVGNVSITVLANDNYLIRSTLWDYGVADVGAVTWASGTTGVTGVVGPSNSLVASIASSGVGSGDVAVLSNGNYVVSSPGWDGGRGAATWGNGTSGVAGVVSAANSLVGSVAGDGDFSSVVALSNGNYVVSNSRWNGSRGAATWGNGTIGRTGTISAANSLTGASASDLVGGGVPGIAPLTNGNYVVNSPLWNSGFVRRGAVTWGNGSTGVTGLVTQTNSLVGAATDDRVGEAGAGVEAITPLTNGNYVVCSWRWNGARGAATWCDGATGRTGLLSSANSLVGTAAAFWVGAFGATALTNGNYVVSSPYVDIGVIDSGAVTWGNGTTGTIGTVNAANSLIGTTSADYVGAIDTSTSGAVALTNGNYVVVSSFWNGVASNAGAVTWANGTTGRTGTVSVANSLVGSTNTDAIGLGGVVALTNGNYVVASPFWDNGATVDAGAATWGDGNSGTTGALSAANSLVGSNANDRVSINEVTALANGNYAVASRTWDNGAATDAGAVTWGDGTTGTTGAVSAANSLVGSVTNDLVGNVAVIALSSGDFVAISPAWDNGGTLNAGAATWGDGTSGSAGPVSIENSLVGFVSVSSVSSAVEVDGAVFAAAFPGDYLSGAVRVGFPGLVNASRFAVLPGDAVTIDPADLTALLDAGTAVVLQANNDIAVAADIIVNNPGGAGGALTLQAGRTIAINANVDTDDGDLTLIANEVLAAGVIDAQRDFGDASIFMAPGSSITAGAGTVHFETRDGAGRSFVTRDDYTLETVTAATVTIVPFVDSVDPDPVTIGDTLTIVGGGLAGATGVTIGATAATILSNASSVITVRVATGTPTGAQTVQVTTAGGADGSQTVTVNAAPAPTVTSVAPNPVDVGGLLAIAGTGLASTTAVTIGGTAAPLLSVTDTLVFVAVAAGTPTGTQTVAVTTPGGTDNTYTVEVTAANLAQAGCGIAPDPGAATPVLWLAILLALGAVYASRRRRRTPA